MQRVPECGSPGPRAPRPWIIALFVVPAVCGPAGADVTIRQRTVSESFPAFTPDTVMRTLIVAGDRSRTEALRGGEPAGPDGARKAPGTAVTITRLEQDLVWALDPAAMEYTETPFTELRARLQQPGAVERDGDAGLAYGTQARRTGEKRKLNGLSCERWRIDVTGRRPQESGPGDTAVVATLDAWTSQRIPGRDELTGFERRAAQETGRREVVWDVPAGVRASYGGLLRELEAQLGRMHWPVRLTLEIAVRPEEAGAVGRQTRFRMRTETLGIESARAPAGAFDLPAGYRKGSRRAS
jgi:hypothetical protein